MTRIMFVCHGNICRSPMAELVMRDLIKKRGLSDKFSVASCATSTEEIWNGVGSPIYPPARDELAKHGLSDDSKRATLLTRSDYDKYDYFICMDSRNITNAMRILDRDPDGKLSKLMSYTGEERDVSDPWYSRRFDVAFRDISEGCEALLDFLTNK